MDLQTRIQIVQYYYASQQSPTAALRLFKKQHGLVKDPFSITTITRLIERFEETGSVADRKRSGRPSADEGTVEKVSKVLEQTSAQSSLGSTSVRRISDECGISKTSVHRIMRNFLHLFPYKLQLLQALQPTDKPQRVAFAEWLLADRDKIPHILWSDEANFSLDGTVNTHNCRIWSQCKPDQCLTESLHSPKLCVWMGFSSQFGLQPFFFETTINSENYLDMLQTHVRPQLAQKRKLSATIFMQDGAPPHFAIKVREYLHGTFSEDRVISRGCKHVWPPRSPDLNPLDYWFWGWLKAKIYHNNKPTTIQQLREKILDVCAQIVVEEFEAAVSNIVSRLEAIIACDGDLIEHTL
ncbi:uncharacterized protein DEA37_0011692 [Paragonimus westermani]|uniref:DUF4817 domain-containing protein n=1 Tax=Paragonimus westermani TaxID=34504 RepID=A0A5J4N2I4_9TREM|nr:uncharacterized protein DEA37_0011692 [Paragonimus westermani]